MSELPSADPVEREILSPSELVRSARALIEQHFGLIWIEGEISNFARPASGHFYFSLKDAQAQVRCAMFKPKSTWLRFRPADGMRVLVRARVSLYEARGEFQMIVEHMEEAGEGALLREFEKLKARLAAEGLFDAANKRAIPELPRRIGVITSPTGAAIRDVLSVISRRFPMLDIEILPVPVQGNEAAPAIVAMLNAASAAARHDVLLLTRGGGSLEDLWAFNDEALARAIRASSIPVVCAVGHEIDFTIADFAADLRAPTPSAAAELLVPDATALRRHVDEIRKRLQQHLRRELQNRAQRTDHVHARLRAQHPLAQLARADERLSNTVSRLRMANRNRLIAAHNRLDIPVSRLQAQRPGMKLTAARERINTLDARMYTFTAHRLAARGSRLSELARALNAISPLATLQRGYAILVDTDNGQVIRSPAQVAPGKALRARVAEGEFKVKVDNA